MKLERFLRVDSFKNKRISGFSFSLETASLSTKGFSVAGIWGKAEFFFFFVFLCIPRRNEKRIEARSFG